ncbi:hypothetical protein PLICRDRAFT_119199, partial [Plicaturopsis crispa FD-325 SS-3]
MEHLSDRYWAATHRPPTLLIHMDEEYMAKFVDGYKSDPVFRERWNEAEANDDKWHAGKRYYKDDKGLLYFRDADFQPRLCVPANERATILREAHETPLGSAHAG